KSQNLHIRNSIHTIKDRRVFHLAFWKCNNENLASPRLVSPHLTSPHLTSPHLTSPHLNSTHFNSFHIFLSLYIKIYISCFSFYI
ncbi:hypothetical protein J3Q64DRAFT_1763353, partial [Phycomyces blakesleeanus]